MIVEDGTGVEGANSYVTVEYADTYHTDRANTAWTAATEDAKEAALIKATDYVEQVYADRWDGEAVYEDQPLSWPRDVATGIPTRLKQAVCQLALEALTTDLNPKIGQGIKRKKVDSIEIEYQDDTYGGTTRPAIDGLLAPILSGSSLNARVVRV